MFVSPIKSKIITFALIFVPCYDLNKSVTRTVRSIWSCSSKTLMSFNNCPAGICPLTCTQSASLLKPVEEVDLGSSGIQGLVAAPVSAGFTGDHTHAEHSKQLQRQPKQIRRKALQKHNKR